MEQGFNNSLYNTLMGGSAAQNYQPQAASFGGRINSLGNALGTVAAAPLAIHKDRLENLITQQSQQGWKNSIDDVYRKYGFQNKQDFDNQLYAAEDASDEATANRLLNMRTMNDELRAQARFNNRQATNKAASYNDWRKNSYVGQAINQNPNDYMGSITNAFRPAGSTIMQNMAQRYIPLQPGVGVNNAAKFNPATITGRMVQNETNRLIRNNPNYLNSGE